MKGLKTIGTRLLNGLFAVIPVAGDSKREWLRKIAFLCAVLVFIGSGVYLLDELVWQPNHTKTVQVQLQELYHEQQTVAQPDGTDTTVYPEGMKDAFRSLYRRNNDLRGWLTFSTQGDDLFDGAIDCPVVQAEDNDFYLTRDFLKEPDKAGSLYFDYRNDLSMAGENRNLIIYGHNLHSGLMFSRFNRLAKPNEALAKRLTTLTLSTLYEEAVYKVFAVMIVNANPAEEPVFNYIRTEFNDESFMSMVNEIRARSLYDFGDVDVTVTDELLTLSTCSNKRETRMTDARTVIVARKVREGEDPAVDTAKTTLNADVLMPKMWYIAGGEELPEVYRDNEGQT